MSISIEPSDELERLRTRLLKMKKDDEIAHPGNQTRKKTVIVAQFSNSPWTGYERARECIEKADPLHGRVGDHFSSQSSSSDRTRTCTGPKGSARPACPFAVTQLQFITALSGVFAATRQWPLQLPLERVGASWVPAQTSRGFAETH